MSPTEEFIERLSALQEGDLSLLRRLAGRPLDELVPGFDLFAGLWWPLREKSPRTPRRELSWLVAKLYGTFPIPHIRPDSGEGPSLPKVLGRCEPRDENARRRYRNRFDTLLCSSVSSLEPHLRWALREVARAVAGHVPSVQDVKGIDWAQLLDDLSDWDRGGKRQKRDVRDIWAENYIEATK